MTLAINVMGLSKRYRIGLSRRPNDLLSQRLTNWFVDSVKTIRTIGRPPSADATIWALKDVSFEVRPGEVIGVIGRNGSGKTTLLKVMSRITAPTEGKIEMWGRLGSLLEVGTGFHPELTGRENIFLNGAILGMRRKEIKAKFDEITDFAGIDRFLDTPVKHYSSGMYVRLAFSVAAHLEPDILLVDEVLAVGDAEFQRKCLNKMESVVSGGRTILFVSHQMNSIRKLCNRCIWLDGGQMRMEGQTAHLVTSYESSWLPSSIEEPVSDKSHSSENISHFIGWEVCKGKGDESSWLNTAEEASFKFKLWVHRELTDGTLSIALWDDEGEMVWGHAVKPFRVERGLHELEYTIPGLPLRPGKYQWQLTLWDGNDVLDNWFAFPSMLICTVPLAERGSREWSGMLNIACDVKVNQLR